MPTTTAIQLGYEGSEHRLIYGIPDFLGDDATLEQINRAADIYRDAVREQYRLEVHPDAYHTPSTSELIVPIDAQIGEIDVEGINQRAWERVERQIIELA